MRVLAPKGATTRETEMLPHTRAHIRQMCRIEIESERELVQRSEIIILIGDDDDLAPRKKHALYGTNVFECSVTITVHTISRNAPHTHTYIYAFWRQKRRSPLSPSLFASAVLAKT